MDQLTNNLKCDVKILLYVLATAMSNIIITGLNNIITYGNSEANVAKIMQKCDV